MVVTAHLEARQSALLQAQPGEIDTLQAFRIRTEQNLAEITRRLSGLIGYPGAQR